MNQTLYKLFQNSGIKILTISIIFSGFFISTLTLHSQIQNEKCLNCHGKSGLSTTRSDGSIKQLYINDSLMHHSPHSGLLCTDCHTDISVITASGHQKDIKSVECTGCHTQATGLNESVHFQNKLNITKNIPVCQTCHGSHYIIKKSSLSKLDLKKKITRMCGNCHFETLVVFSASIHGTALFEKNYIDSPGCTDCHGEHNIKKTGDSGSMVYKSNIQITCGKCHNDENIMNKYGKDSNKLKTYESSFHGIGSRFGDNMSANCSSCHGAHDIKPQSDPTSSINSNNLLKTCGKCHKDANINYVSGKIHVDISSNEAGAIFYVNIILKCLTVITLALFVMHVVLTQYTRLKRKRINK